MSLAPEVWVTPPAREKAERENLVTVADTADPVAAGKGEAALEAPADSEGLA